MSRRSANGATRTVTKKQRNPAVVQHEQQKPARGAKPQEGAGSQKHKNKKGSSAWLVGAVTLVAALVVVGSFLLQQRPHVTKQLGKKEYDAMHRFGPQHFPESVPQVEVVDWAKVRKTLPDGTTLSDYLKTRNTALKLINSGPELWPATNWTPSSMLRKMEEMGGDIPGGAKISMMEMLQPENMYFSEEMAEKLGAQGISILPNAKDTTMPMDMIYEMFRKVTSKIRTCHNC